MVRSGFINARSLIGRSVTSLHIKNNGVDNTMLIAMASAWKVHARSVKHQGGDLLRLKQLDLSEWPGARPTKKGVPRRTALPMDHSDFVRRRADVDARLQVAGEQPLSDAEFIALRLCACLPSLFARPL